MVNDAIDDGFAVLALTNLEVGVSALASMKRSPDRCGTGGGAPPDLPPSRMLQPKLIWLPLLTPIPADDGAYGLADEGAPS
jgi:hypothetical protein